MLGTDVEEAMYRVNGSVYIRSTFNVADSSVIDSMALGMQYDDGFVLFLNGEMILDVNGPPPAELAWNSEADSSHPDTQALEFEAFDLSPNTPPCCAMALTFSRSRVSTFPPRAMISWSTRPWS